MRLLAAFTSIALATGTLALPTVLRNDQPAEETSLEVRDTSAKSQFYPTPIVSGMLPFQATKIVNAFNYLLANPKADNFAATANALFSKVFTDTSDSINQLAGIPVCGSP